MSAAAAEAERALRKAVAENKKDPAILSSLAYIEQRRGDKDGATELYQQALTADPNRLDAAMNLGVIEANNKHLGEAVKLWQAAFERAPGRSAIGMNLAQAYCATGQYDQAKLYVKRVLEFNPDLGAAKRLMTYLNAATPSCGPR
jgi:Flp pilus assembly protein TadD